MVSFSQGLGLCQASGMVYPWRGLFPQPILVTAFAMGQQQRQQLGESVIQPSKCWVSGTARHIRCTSKHHEVSWLLFPRNWQVESSVLDSLCVKVLAPAFGLVVSYGIRQCCLMLTFAINAHHWAIARRSFFSESRVGLVWEMCGRFTGFHPAPPGSKVSSQGNSRCGRSSHSLSSEKNKSECERAL